DRPSVSIEDSKSINEGSTASFDVTLTKAAAVDVTVDIDTLYGTATAEDIKSIVVKDSAGQVVTANADGSYTVKAGETQLTVEVATKDDATYEGDEKLSLKVTGVTGVNGTDTSDLTITDDGTGPVDPGTPNPDDRPSVSIEDSKSINEGSTASFDVTLTKAAAVDVTVDIDTLYGTATAEDITSIVVKDSAGQVVTANADGSYTVKAGETQLTVEVATKDDATYEGDEKLSLKVTGATGVTGTETGELTIKDDADKPTVTGVTNSAGAAGINVAEGAVADIKVTLSNESKTATTVDLTLNSGTADKNVDFTGTQVDIVLSNGTVLKDVAVASDGSFQVSLPAGQTDFTVKVQTTQDSIFEGDETFTVTAKTSTQQAAESGTVTIQDNDGTPTVTGVTNSAGAAGINVAEGAVADIKVTLSNESKTATTVDLTLNSGTADKNVDFTGTQVDIVLSNGTVLKDVAVASDGSFQVSLPAGQTDFTVKVQTTQDTIFEGDETFTVTAKT
ncbi:Calx-beta domain-containing protein, partial [Vibrio sp. MED222]|uniref:Calx-beta domain-containing protein n=1 Tax=Vibrio sp. MED222 TaxID=314290 RepID=UPI000068D7DA